MKEIFSALAKAQSKFEAALKSSNNPHFRSRYAALDACVDAVRAALNSEGVFLTQSIESVESGITVETVFAHSSGEIYSGGKLFMPVSKHDAQGYGSALTYARRYSLLTACGVAPQDDDDGNAAAATAPAKPVRAVAKQPEPPREDVPEPFLSEKQIDEVTKIANEVNADFDGFLEWVSTQLKQKVKSLSEVPAFAYPHLIKQLNKKRVVAA